MVTLQPLTALPSHGANLSSSTHGFPVSGGVYKTIDFPGALAPLAAGVHFWEYVVEIYFDSVGGGVHYRTSPEFAEPKIAEATYCSMELEKGTKHDSTECS